MKVLRLILVTILITGSGCCSIDPDPPITLPARPVLIPLTDEEQREIPADTLRKLAENDLALKQYAKKLEARITAHDEALQ